MTTKYVADVKVEVELDGDEEFDEAHRLVDEIMQRAWDTDQGRWQHQGTWHFELAEDAVTAVLKPGEAPEDDPVPGTVA